MIFVHEFPGERPEALVEGMPFGIRSESRKKWIHVNIHAIYEYDIGCISDTPRGGSMWRPRISEA